MKKQDVKEQRDEPVVTPARRPEADQPPPRLRRSAEASAQAERGSASAEASASVAEATRRPGPASNKERPNGDEPGYGYGV